MVDERLADNRGVADITRDQLHNHFHSESISEANLPLLVHAVSMSIDGNSQHSGQYQSCPKADIAGVSKGDNCVRPGAVKVLSNSPLQQPNLFPEWLEGRNHNKADPGIRLFEFLGKTRTDFRWREHQIQRAELGQLFEYGLRVVGLDRLDDADQFWIAAGTRQGMHYLSTISEGA